VLTAADVLRSMPHVCSLWEAGGLSWGQVRNIALKAARRSLAERETLDRRLAATDDLDAYGPDGLLDAVDRAIDHVRATARSNSRRPTRIVTTSSGPRPASTAA
jgi:hypothetical protein